MQTCIKSLLRSFHWVYSLESAASVCSKLCDGHRGAFVRGWRGRYNLLNLFAVILPVHILQYFSFNTKKLLRRVCKLLRSEVHRTVELITLHRYNIDILTREPVAICYPHLTTLCFESSEVDSVKDFLSAHLEHLTNLKLIDFFKYHSSMKLDCWQVLVDHCPPSCTIRININDSLLRRMDMQEVMTALQQLHDTKPKVKAEFNTSHHYFGFRDTSPAVLQFLSAAAYISSLSFSLGLEGRETQTASFFNHFGTNTTLTSLAITNYETFGCAPVAPILQHISALVSLTSLNIDAQCNLYDLWPLQQCPHLTFLCVVEHSSSILSAARQLPSLLSLHVLAHEFASESFDLCCDPCELLTFKSVQFLELKVTEPEMLKARIEAVEQGIMALPGLVSLRIEVCMDPPLFDAMLILHLLKLLPQLRKVVVGGWGASKMEAAVIGMKDQLDALGLEVEYEPSRL